MTLGGGRLLGTYKANARGSCLVANSVAGQRNTAPRHTKAPHSLEVGACHGNRSGHISRRDYSGGSPQARGGGHNNGSSQNFSRRGYSGGSSQAIKMWGARSRLLAVVGATRLTTAGGGKLLGTQAVRARRTCLVAFRLGAASSSARRRRGYVGRASSQSDWGH